MNRRSFLKSMAVLAAVSATPIALADDRPKLYLPDNKFVYADGKLLAELCGLVHMEEPNVRCEDGLYIRSKSRLLHLGVDPKLSYCYYDHFATFLKRALPIGTTHLFRVWVCPAYGTGFRHVVMEGAQFNGVETWVTPGS